MIKIPVITLNQEGWLRPVRAMRPRRSKPDEPIHGRSCLFAQLLGKWALHWVYLAHPIGSVHADDAPTNARELHVRFFELLTESTKLTQRLVGPDVPQLLGIRPEFRPGHLGQVIGLGEIRPRGTRVAYRLEIADVPRAGFPYMSLQFYPIGFRKRANRPDDEVRMDVGALAIPGQLRAAQDNLRFISKPFAGVEPTHAPGERSKGRADFRQGYSGALG